MRRTVSLPFELLIVFWAAGCQAAPATLPALPGLATNVPPAAHPTSDNVATPQTTPSVGPRVQVTVTLTDTSITSTLTTFRVGVPYTFTIKNAGTRPLCFFIAPSVDATGSLEASQGHALVAMSKGDIGVGAVTEARYTFTDVAVGRRLEFSCLLKREYKNGVRLAISVTK